MSRKRHYTIFVIPETASKIFKFKVPWLPARLLFVISAVAIFLFAFFVIDYINSKSKVYMLNSLRRENQALREQMLELASRAKGVENEMRMVKQMEAKIRIMLNAEKPEGSQASFGIGGSSQDDDIYAPLYLASNTDIVFQRTASRLDNLEEALKKQETNLVELHEIMQDRSSILSSTPSIWPTRGWITSGFGYRVYPFTGESKFHEGIDISTRIGTPVVASADGIVTDTGYDISYGNSIIIDHGYGFTTRYGHLSRIEVKIGTVVKRGMKIGEVGNTGLSTGPHLHYEIRNNGVPVNPENYILN